MATGLVNEQQVCGCQLSGGSVGPSNLDIPLGNINGGPGRSLAGEFDGLHSGEAGEES